MLVSVTQLSELTGVSRDTIRKRCGSMLTAGVRAQEIESSDALRMIYCSDLDFDYDLEKARLTHHQANIAALDEEVKKKNLLPADIVKTHWESMVANMRAKLLNLPGRLAASVIGHDTIQDAEREAMNIIREALTEISRNGIP